MIIRVKNVLPLLAALSPCCESHAFATLAPDTIVVEKKQDPATARNNENVVLGKVTDVNGEPLTGVSVVVKGTRVLTPMLMATSRCLSVLRM